MMAMYLIHRGGGSDTWRGLVIGCSVFAALVIAALKAEGESVVSELWHIDRGYALFDEKLKALGAGIVRTDL